MNPGDNVDVIVDDVAGMNGHWYHFVTDPKLITARDWLTFYDNYEGLYPLKGTSFKKVLKLIAGEDDWHLKEEGISHSHLF